MKSYRAKLLSSTVLHVIVGAGIAAGGVIALSSMTFAASSSGHGANPAAQAKPAAIQVAACGAAKACNPCAAKACNPCAAKACNPCAAKACNPCAAKACNPCAAKACNPCAAKACNPCAAKSACNPCAGSNPCNPCNPCAAGAAASSKCVVPRLQTAAANPCAAKKACNPCAAKACNPCAAKACNPCAAKACNPCAAKNACNPCAASNPCNPCAASNPCNPCAAGAAPELTTAEANAAYDCLRADMVAGYAKSNLDTSRFYVDWASFNTAPYVSDTHGGRLVNNFANAVAASSYGKYEDAGRMPVGAVLAKDSFQVTANGKAGPGPLFIMQKMHNGFSAETNNWKYSMVMPNGQIFGETGGKNAKGMVFCHECHVAVADDQDHMFFLPEEFRK